MPGRLAGRVALVTGSSRGIGRETALRLAREGASLVINYLRGADASRRVAAEIESAGGEALVVQADVRDRASVDRLVEAAVDRYGRIDIVVSNAGTLVTGASMTMSGADLDEAMRVNVGATLNLMQSIESRQPDGWPISIVAVAATSAIGTSVRNITPHVLAKASVIALVKQLAQELGGRGIRVNALMPGAVDTEITLPGGSLHEALHETRRKQRENTALGRIGRASEIAAVIAFLASDDASFITGQAISVDGGRADFLSRSA